MPSITAPKELLPILAALATGEPVELECRYKYFNSEWTPKLPSTDGELSFFPETYQYRIKPKLVEVILNVVQVTHLNGNVSYAVRPAHEGYKLVAYYNMKEHKREYKIIHSFHVMMTPKQAAAYT